MPRQSRIDFPGALHHVMVRGVARGAIFQDDADRQAFLDELALLLPQGELSCLAWALLPNHAHLLIRTGSWSLSRLMLRWLTRYAGWYNRRHRRAGHLFQNRYKAILCEEDPYLLELVRYIHLNPVRAHQVSSVAGLERYRWSGHAVLLGHRRAPWQSCDDVLSLFDQRLSSARTQYRQFVSEGLGQGHRGDLSGGGLVRSLGVRPEALEGRRRSARVAGDPRILGDGGFVEAVMRKVEMADRRRDRTRRRVSPEGVIRAAAKVAGVADQEIRHANRRRAAVVGRALACKWLVEDLGMRGTVVAGLLGITGAAVTQGVERGRRLEAERGVSLERAT